MNMKIIIQLGLLLLFNLIEIYPCSIFYAKTDSTILAGNSEDWDDLNSMVKFIPASNGLHGRFVFGFKDWGLDFCPWGGVNDQGLFYDWASIGFRDENFHAKGTISYDGVLADKMQAECSTVEEAIAIFRKYNCPGLGGAHILIGDRFGNSVIIEAGEEDTISVFRISANYQVATNFMTSYLGNPEMYRWIQCPRYDYINEMLANNNSISIDLFQQILQHVGSNHTLSPTIYSNAYDFKSGKMYIYNLYNFEEVLILDVNKALSNGYQFYHLSSLFSRLRKVYPTEGSVLKSSTVSLKWVGDSKNYTILLADNQQMNNPVEIDYTSPVENSAGLGWLSVVFIAALFGRLLVKNKILLFCGLFILFGTSSCEIEFVDLPGTISGLNHEKLIDMLETGKTYYWKVIAHNSYGFDTETKVSCFTVAN